MKISVLIPTRGGGRFLEACLDAALCQDDEAFEVVVADNANTDETGAILASRADDDHLVVVRSDTVLPVADNWNLALSSSTGEYIVVIGDDDLLFPWSLAAIRDGLAGRPDCLTYNAYSFVAPASIMGSEVARYAPRHFRFDDELSALAVLDRDLRKRLVRDLFRFRPRFPLNMQTTAFARTMCERVPVPFFRQPFPDHLALGGMLLTADRWVLRDEPLLVVGVSPKSFGHFVYSGDGEAGQEYLGIDTGFAGALPGNALLNGMHRWLEVLAEEHPAELGGTRVSRRDYVARQVWSWYAARRTGSLEPGELGERLGLLSPADWLRLGSLVFDPAFLRLAWRRVRHREGVGLMWPDLLPAPGVSTIVEFADWLAGAGPEEGA